MGLILSGDLAVLQASMLDSLAFDLFALFYDCCGPAEVGVGWFSSAREVYSCPMMRSPQIGQLTAR